MIAKLTPRLSATREGATGENGGGTGIRTKSMLAYLISGQVGPAAGFYRARTAEATLRARTIVLRGGGASQAVAPAPDQWWAAGKRCLGVTERPSA
jgi:hypothetical protein